VFECLTCGAKFSTQEGWAAHMEGHAQEEGDDERCEPEVDLARGIIRDALGLPMSPVLDTGGCPW
jgi:hypothetical protein